MIQYKCSCKWKNIIKEVNMDKLKVLEYEINTKIINQEDYVSLTDIAKKVNEEK